MSHTTLNKRGEKDMRILTREFNAKIGADNTGYNKVTGLLKQNGERFAHGCFLQEV